MVAVIAVALTANRLVQSASHHRRWVSLASATESSSRCAHVCARDVDGGTEAVPK